jgi:uroporphyrinogen-III decarboxylase
MPGINGVDDDQVPQMLEIEMAGPEVYEKICRDGFLSVLAATFKKYNPQLGSKRELLRILCGFTPFAIKARRHLSKWEKRGIPCLTGSIPGLIAFDVLSGLRSMARFCIDLHRHPDLVLRALAVTNRFYIEMMVKGAKATGARFAFIGSARPSATFISPEYFERFALSLFVEATEGLTPFLHFDSDWTPMLPYLKELPRRKCILDLDGTTDIFRAKEVLGDHMCIMGDVPAALLTLGTPEEVDAYCERLIKEVGAGGGFILSSGCSTPPEARPENVKVMVESVKKHKP